VHVLSRPIKIRLRKEEEREGKRGKRTERTARDETRGEEKGLEVRLVYI